MDLNSIMDMTDKYTMNVFSRTPVCFTHGQGICLWDTEGKKYVDFLAGIAVSVLGHAHPRLVKAISDQAQRLIHCSNLYYIENQARLAKLLVENTCADKVFFANSGAEANEGAIKLARIYFKKKGMPQKYKIITLVNSFHGRTLATTAATGQVKYQEPYTPLTPGFLSVPINDMDALVKALDENTCAIMLEPIQGESGVNPLTAEYMRGIRELCDEKGLLMILDEVQTGMGRTGELFAYMHYGIEPDIFTTAKGLGNGVPIGALCAKDSVARAFQPGDHGSTFGGNPLSCAAGLAVMETLLEENLVKNSREMGSYLMEKLSLLKDRYGLISQVRGLGLMVGIEFTGELGVKVKELLLARGYLVGSVGKSVIRLLPPLIVSKDDIDGFISAFDAVLGELSEQQEEPAQN